ncbi:DUF7322 domain-containing protein [Natrarchaeobaculum aegyptiacum]|uniref:DUF7322 domain-containing protein n=1 Tax=Natrarchaeobaculum aegyptiacum TaxID=745377 RepID=A0A2Z2HYX4_9EURY|nr:hypothetical protein [Natrarchaeobaculum aegyptiacum]ARS91625.1 hypothetical protein B1756_01795 [Natrarchaeobaculum aegyptiacum]
MFDRNEESHETDAEKDLRDPESDSLTIPRVDTEDAGGGLHEDFRSEFDTESLEAPDVAPDIDPDTSDVPPELLKTFWSIVLVVNGAVLAYALGLMILVFWGDVERGLALVAGGVILSGFAYKRYRNYRRWREEEGEDERDEDGDADATDGESTPTTGDEVDSESNDRDDATNDDSP